MTPRISIDDDFNFVFFICSDGLVRCLNLTLWAGQFVSADLCQHILGAEV